MALAEGGGWGEARTAGTVREGQGGEEEGRGVQRSGERGGGTFQPF